MLRVQGEFSSPEHQEKFDRIQVKIDINTFQGDRESRFEAQDMSTFAEIAKQVIDQLSEQMAATYHE